MDIIDITMENIDREHICCAITEKKGENCVASKKAWMKARFAEGLVFKRLDVRGKAFIEYIPAERAWCPMEAPGYLFINCFWVSGQFKGQGHAGRLLEACIQDAKAKGKQGLVLLSSKKKMPFLSDPKFLTHMGFRVADTAEPYYELRYLPFHEDAPVPRFREQAKPGRTEETGLVLYYTNQCPHTAKYAPIFEEIAREKGEKVKLILIQTAEQAQNAPAPFTTYSLYDNGVFVTNEILSEKKAEAYLEKRKSVPSFT